MTKFIPYLWDATYYRPNANTVEAIEEAKAGKYAGTLNMDSFESFMKSVNDIK